MSKNITLKELTHILSIGDFDQLIGIVENNWLDFKGDPYHLKDEYNKSELAKDVAAMAIHDGGMILIGPRTDKNPAHRGEEVVEVKTFIEPYVDTKQYHDVLNNWIYPMVNVDIKWHKSKSDTTKGIFSINVQKQPDHLWPPLLTQTILNGRRRAIFVGYVERKEDFTDVKNISELHEMIRNGAIYISKIKEMVDNINEIKEKIYSTVSAPPSLAKDVEANLDSRVNDALKAVELENAPAYILSATPLYSNSIPCLFQPDDAVFRKLEQPETLRSGGYDISMSDISRPILGELRRSLSKKREIRDLWRDGTLIFAADLEYLCWGAPQNFPTLINSLAIVESAYLFVKHFEKVIGAFASIPEDILYRIELRNPQKNVWFLAPSSLKAVENHLQQYYKKSPSPDVIRTIKIKYTSEVDLFERRAVRFKLIDEGQIAFKLIAEIYNWFGFDNDAIPYSNKDKDGRNIIDPKEIQRLHEST